MKKMLALILSAILLVCALTGCDSSDYKKATELYDAGDYQEAAAMFKELGDYEDSADKVIDCKYMQAEELFDDGKYEDAMEIYDEISSHEDAEDKITECTYLLAEDAFNAGDYEKAIELYTEVSSYEDAADKILEAQTQLMYVTYADVFTALAQNVWFYEATSVNAVNVISFTQENANTKQIYYDGNGPHTTEETSCSYIVDDSTVTVTLADQSELKLAYTLDGDTISFGDGYFTPEQVAADLNGYWGLKDLSYNSFTGFSTSEYIYYFENGSVQYESATTAYGYNDGSYYYYGPYEGTYTVNENGLVVEAKNEWQFGFVISEGKVAMCRCGKILSTYEGFKGEDGFSF